jgi:8-oxo-dGTP diphosphatase
MIKSISAGGVVFNNRSEVLVVSQVFPNLISWSLPKGRVNENEDILNAAKREIREESGITNLQIIKDLGSYERPRLDDPTEVKTIYMFLFKTEEFDLKSLDPDNPEAKWVNKNDVGKVLTAEKDQEFFRSIKNLF